MSLLDVLDFIFPHIRTLPPKQQTSEAQRLADDLVAIDAASWNSYEERALDEAQRAAAAESERVKTAETKATTYLAVLAALVPVIITLQAANWEKKAGPAPDAARLFVLAVATVYVAAAGYHAFKTLQVSGFQRVGEADIAAAWKTAAPLRKLTRATLRASRSSRDTVNAKITQIRVTHEHLLRALVAFILLLLLDPLFYALGFRNVASQNASPHQIIVVQQLNVKTSSQADASRCDEPAAHGIDRRTADHGRRSVERASGPAAQLCPVSPAPVREGETSPIKPESGPSPTQ